MAQELFGNIQIFDLGDIHAVGPFETITHMGDMQSTIEAGEAALESWCAHKQDRIVTYRTDEGLLFRILDINNDPNNIYAGAEKRKS
jgi:hypothetical protein